MEKKSLWKEWIAPVLVLFLVCGVIAGALAYTNSITNPIIEANSKKTADENRTKLLPTGDSFTEYKGNLLKTDDGKVWVEDVYTANNKTGVVMTVVTKSFGGELTEMIGIDKAGAITGVTVTKHKDTAGLGTKPQAPDYLAQYKGVKDLQFPSVKDESTKNKNEHISYITGATISSSAIHYGIYEALQQFKAMGGVK